MIIRWLGGPRRDPGGDQRVPAVLRRGGTPPGPPAARGEHLRPPRAHRATGRNGAAGPEARGDRLSRPPPAGLEGMGSWAACAGTRHPCSGTNAACGVPPKAPPAGQGDTPAGREPGPAAASRVVEARKPALSGGASALLPLRRRSFRERAASLLSASFFLLPPLLLQSCAALACAKSVEPVQR